MKSIRRSLKNDRQSPPHTAGSAASYSSNHHVLSSSSVVGGSSNHAGPGAGGSAHLGDKIGTGSNAITMSRPAGQQGKTPPKAVIRAIASYRARSLQELTFEAGDFFHVTGERGGSASDGPEWFEAANPLTGARGLVPAHCFQLLGRNEKENSMRGASAGSGAVSTSFTPGAAAAAPARSLSPIAASGSAPTQLQPGQRISGSSASPNPSPLSAMFPHRGGTPSSSNTAATSNNARTRGKHQPLYGVVQYDFRAERPDELDAKRGESIIVIAQSNHEWFVAKPIGRLGGPGLIPVSFIAISDTTTGEPLPLEKVKEMIESGMVPPVDEWKKMTAEYKQASIPLGKFDFATSSATSQTASQQGHPYTSRNGPPAASSTSLGTQGSSNRPPSASAQAASKPYSVPASTSSSSLRQASQQQQQQQSAAQQYQQQYQMSQGLQQSSGSSSSYPRETDRYSEQRGGGGNEYDEGVSPTSGGGQQDAQASNTPMQPSPRTDLAEAYERYGLLTSATVESFHSEEDNYWFHLRVTFAQSGYSLILYRLYDDFLEFQYALMDEHPIEAGRAVPADAPPGTQPRRTIPKMPGPVDLVDEVVCAQRVDDLTVYLKGLCALPDYIKSHPIFYDFLMLRPGDIEASVPDEDMEARWEAEKARDRERDRELAHSATGTRQRGLDEEVVEYLDRMQLNGNTSGASGTSQGASSNTPNNLAPLQTSSNGPFAPGYSVANASSQPGYHSERHASNEYRPPSAQSGHGNGHISPTSGGPRARNSDQSGPLSAGSGINFISPFAAAAAASTSSLGVSSSSQQQQGSAPPFVKIKIFHRNTDDLIAIRVPPNIRLDALLDKVRERLGGEVEHVRYRDEGNIRLSASQAQSALSLPGGARLVELQTDAELDTWMKTAQRLVAYVD